MKARRLLAALLLGISACSANAPNHEDPASNIVVVSGERPIAPLNLDALLDFRTPSDCDFSEEMNAVIRALAVYDDELRPVPGKLLAPPGFESAFGEPTVERTQGGLNVEVPLEGQWHGLPVTALIADYWNGGDSPAIAIRFAAQKSDVVAMLNGHGFSFPQEGASGSDADIYPSSMAVETDGAGAVFSCT